MKDILSALSWPIVAVIFMFIFKKPIADLFPRLKRAGKDWVEFGPPHPQSSNDTTNLKDGLITEPHHPKSNGDKKGLSAFEQNFVNPLQKQVEDSIKSALDMYNIKLPEDRERALIKSHALLKILSHFERTYNAIWLSQMNFLNALNTRPAGMTEADILVFYNDGKSRNPDWYREYQLAGWVSFLLSHELITFEDSNAFITIAGQEFLKWTISERKPGPYYG
jgi:hypothetical protein